MTAPRQAPAPRPSPQQESNVLPILPYTLNRMMESQRAVIIRDQGTADAYGAEASPNWQTLGAVPCICWWEKQSGRGPGKLYATPQREIAQSEGGMLLPQGTDITARDRISNVTDPAGNVLINGPFDIVAVFADRDHVEVAWKSATEARVSA